MFDRFTEDAVRVIMDAQQESRRSSHNYVGPEQILLGLATAKNGIAFKVLSDAGVTLDNARAEVTTISGAGTDVVDDAIPFTDAAKRALELGWDEGQKLRHAHIGSEHLLLGLIRDRSSTAVTVLQNLGIDIDLLRASVIRVINERSGTVSEQN
jgi:ATP-dependent Clp protease ATP-binding subunit ClpC